jgi:hypothetical protein
MGWRFRRRIDSLRFVTPKQSSIGRDVSPCERAPAHLELRLKSTRYFGPPPFPRVDLPKRATLTLARGRD